MKLAIIVAHANNLVIGKDGKLPWHISEDLKHFKKRTMGKPLLMGRGVFEEFGGKPLPGRENIVLTRKKFEDVKTFDSIPKALKYLNRHPKVYVAGGGQIYRQLMPLADSMEITEIKKNYEGDVTFPEYRDQIGKIWKEVHREDHGDFAFVDYERVPSTLFR
ncbi:MAG: dihydrofolate reductase [Balneolales bacterium]